jgi:hypothetical protein
MGTPILAFFSVVASSQIFPRRKSNIFYLFHQKKYFNMILFEEIYIEIISKPDISD